MDDVYDQSKFEVESYNMLIDSSRRDVATEPEASEYTIDLTSTPFKNVVGVDLLAASVPRTGYVIDSGCNEFSYALGTPPHEPGNVVTATLVSGDYNLSQICDEINRAVSSSAPAGTVVPVASPYTNPAEISNKIAFDSPAPFSLYLDRKSLGGRIGFGTQVTQAGVDAGWFEGTSAWKEKSFVDANVYVAVRTANVSSESAFIGPMEFSDSATIGDGLTCTQTFTALATGVPSYATFAVSSFDPGTSLSVRVIDLSGSTVASGSAAIDSSGDFSVALSASATSDGVTAGSECSLEIVPSGGSCSIYVNPQNLPNDPLNSLTINGVSQSEDEALCATLTVLTSGYRVVSPGVVDLTGDRFLIIRCPEIETYTVRGERLAAETVHPGIGLLTLGTYGFTESRLDFFHAKPRTLQTPIAKLSKFTIRLESQNGSTYPTRGCDHSLLLCVRSAVPKAVERSGERPSILAPGYTPDVWKYRREVEARVRPGQFAQISSY